MCLNPNKLTLADLLGVETSIFEDIGVNVLNLGVRSTNCLDKAHVKTVAELLSKTKEDLLNVRTMGRKSLREIIQKAKSYISNFQSIDDLPQNNTLITKKTASNSNIKMIVEAVLAGKNYPVDNLTEKQLQNLNKLNETLEIIGKEFCDKTYADSEYGIEICDVLCEFVAPNIQYLKEMSEVEQKFKHLPDSIQTLKIVPFITAYTAKTKRNLSCLISECDDTTAVKNIPGICKKMEQEDGRVLLASEANKFLDWLNFDINDIETSILDNMKNFFHGKSTKSLDMIFLRCQGETLESIATIYNLSRERIRQIETKVFAVFRSIHRHCNYDLIMLTYALKNGNEIISFDNLKDVIGFEFAALLWSCMKQTDELLPYYYSKTLDKIIVKTEIVKIDEIEISAIKDHFLSLPNVVNVSLAKEMMAEFADKNSIPLEIVNSIFNDIYRLTGNFFHKGRLTIVDMCEYVLKNWFQGGFKIADEFEAGRFKHYLIESFGDRMESVTSRAIDANVGKIGLLCDRGKYIHKDYLQVDQSVIDAVNSYVEQSPRSFLLYGEIFEAMKDTFYGTQITNRYLLQGALKKYGCRFSTGRNFVRKVQSVNIVDELESFVEERGVVHKSEILAEFTSLGDAGLMQVVARSSKVFNIDNGCYIHASQFDIQPGDYEQLRDYLAKACRDIPVNIRSVYDDLVVQFPEFMCRNDFDDRNRLYAVLNYMFMGEFSFSRPYIAKLGSDDVSNKGVILQHIEDFDNIEIDEVIDICEENKIHYVSPTYLFKTLAPNYLRINKTTIMKYELTGINDTIISQVINILNDSLMVRDYLVGSKINDFLWYPEIMVDWNEFLLENLVVQSGKIKVIYMSGNPIKHSNAIYVSDRFKEDTFDSFLIKILTDEVRKGSFSSEMDMREWLKDEGLIGNKLPKILENAKYFYFDEKGAHCTAK